MIPSSRSLSSSSSPSPSTSSCCSNFNLSFASASRRSPSLSPESKFVPTQSTTPAAVSSPAPSTPPIPRNDKDEDISEGVHFSLTQGSMSWLNTSRVVQLSDASFSRATSRIRCSNAMLTPGSMATARDPELPRGEEGMEEKEADGERDGKGESVGIGREEGLRT